MATLILFDFDQPFVVAGLILGLASSLHCFGMCSGIATSLCLSASSMPGSTTRSTLAANLLVNIGRLAGYAIAGCLVGSFGATLFGMLDHSITHAVLRWASAASLGFIGLSMTGAVELPRALYRIGDVVSVGLSRLRAYFSLPPMAGFLLSGLVWGFLPCAMVYAALFYAMLTGSWSGGTMTMLGFGLGTLPAILSTITGITLLHRATRSSSLGPYFGVALVLLALISLIDSPAAIAAFCRAI